MLTLLLATVLTPALAADDGVQVRAYQGAVDFAETTALSLDPSFEYQVLSSGGPVYCYDELGVLDFNLDVPIDVVDLVLDEDRLTVTVVFGTIHGDYWTVYGLDADAFDACPQFSKPIDSVTVIGGQLVADLELDTGFGGAFGSPVLDFRWAEPPVVSGDILIDTGGEAWTDFATNEVVDWIEPEIHKAAADAVTETLPPLLEEFLGEASYAGDYAGLATDIQLAGATLEPQSLWMQVDLDVAAAATQPCEIGNPGAGPLPAGLRSPILPLDNAIGADLGVGVTEELIGQALHASWEAGWFCMESDSVDELLDGLRLWIDPDAIQLEGWGTLDSPPQIVATASGIEVVVPDVRVEVTGVVDGSRVPIVVTRFDLRGTATPGFDQSLTAMTLSLVDPRFDFHEVTLKHIPTPNAAKPFIEEQVEAWAAGWARDSLNDVVLFDALYYAWDVALLLDRSEPVDGGLELYFDLYDINDPEVDQVPPEATLTVVDTNKRSAHFEAEATDDREGPLAFAWQVNGGGWSDWSTRAELDLANLADGEYTVEVTARDTWLNVDETPDAVTFTVKAPISDGSSSCGCATGTPAGPWAAVLGLLLLARRRP